MRTSPLAALTASRSRSVPGTRSMSPNEQKMTLGREANATALSIFSSGVTHTGQPGPCSNVTSRGSSSSIPYFRIACVWPPQTSMSVHGLVTRPWTLMEVCGGQTHAILKYGIDELLPREVTLLHGPGCPVCVTPLEKIDRALALASRPNVIFCSFGDMLRVPGTDRDLLAVKAAGGDVRIVYSPLDALKVARENLDKQVVFFAVGFETTAPGNAMAVYQARRAGLENFSVLVSHVLVPPALEAILASPSCRVQGFLAAGHVCAVMGYTEYLPIAARYKIPIVVTGFEPLDLLQGIYLSVKQLEEGRAEVENQYSRVVTRQGNRQAQSIVTEVFGIVDRAWRGIGVIPGSGLGLREAYAGFDAERRFDLSEVG